MRRLRHGILASSGGGVVYDTDYQAILDRATTLGYTLPSAGQQVAQNTLVLNLKSSGVWSKLDALKVYATDGDSDYATINWITPTANQTIKVNAPTFTPDSGFNGNGSTSYLDEGYNPNVDGSNYQLTSSSYGFWLNSNEGNNTYIFGGISGSNARTFIKPRMTGNIVEGAISSSGTPLSGATVTDSSGLIHLNRNGTTVAFYKNGSSILSATNTAGALTNLDMYSGATNNSGTAAFYSPSVISMVFFGDDLSSEASAFYNHFNTYITSI